MRSVLRLFFLVIFFAGLLAGGVSVAQAPDFGMVGYAALESGTTGGAGGAVITIRSLDELEAWAATREKNHTPQIVHISGKISSPATTVVTIKNGANLSVFGIGGGAELVNVGLNFREYDNIIVRNLKIHEVFYPNDALTIDECEHVWVDHNEFYSKIGAGIGVDTYDGLLDIKNGARFVTVSWNHFHDHMKNVLIGHTDNPASEVLDREIRVTFHHNLFENTDGRNPSLRWGAVHMFNNYLKNITDYGLAARQGAHALIENNVYENVKLPLATNKFDGIGNICERGNIFTGTSGANAISQNGCDWWTATTLPYSYTLDPVSSVANIVPAHVGVGKVDVTGVVSQSFQLIPKVAGQGTISPSGGTYEEGASVTLTATPAEGYLFSGWSGDATGTTNPLTVVMNNNKTITATFVVDNGGAPSPTVRILATATPATGLCSFNGSTRTPSGDGGTVINMSNTAGSSITWKVEVPAPGTYQLKWRYAGGGSSATEAAKLIVNGATANESVSFPKPQGSNSYLINEPVSVSLGNGVNEIKIEVSGTFADLEWLEVTGVAPKATDCSAAVGSGGGTPTSAGKEITEGGTLQVYPNPFTGVATFEVKLTRREKVTISLFSVDGAKVDVVANGYLDAGLNNIVYENQALKSGMYFYLVETGATVQRGKLFVK